MQLLGYPWCLQRCCYAVAKVPGWFLGCFYAVAKGPGVVARVLLRYPGWFLWCRYAVARVSIY